MRCKPARRYRFTALSAEPAPSCNGASFARPICRVDWGSAVAQARAEPFHYPNGYEELDQRLTRL